MKTRGFLMAALLLFAGCNQSVQDEPVESYNTGCGKGDEISLSDDGIATRAYDGSEREETIRLKYSSSGLVVIQSNGLYNCGINVQEMVYTSSVEGQDVQVTAWVDPIMKCLCLVRTVQVVVPGLKKGKEYLLHFNDYAPIQFKYSKSLDITVTPVDASAN